MYVYIYIYMYIYISGNLGMLDRCELLFPEFPISTIDVCLHSVFSHKNGCFYTSRDLWRLWEPIQTTKVEKSRSHHAPYGFVNGIAARSNGLLSISFFKIAIWGTEF